jgi:hypothetical protein
MVSISYVSLAESSGELGKGTGKIDSKVSLLYKMVAILKGSDDRI